MRGGKRQGAGRKIGSLGKKIKRNKSTITLLPADWKFLNDLGPSRGRAVEKLIEFWKMHKAD